MIVAIHQPQYLPWLPYFDKADQADVFIHLDNVQFMRRGVQNRNAIKGAQGALWLTVPVSASRDTLICDVRLAENPWRASHIRSIELHYRRAPYFALFEELRPLLEAPWERLVDLNIAVTEWFFDQLGVRCRRVRASELGATGMKEDLMIALTRAVEGTIYLSGTGAAVYQQAENFTRVGIELRYQSYRGQPYPQLFPEAGFVPDLSALDLLLNTGPGAREILLAGRQPATSTVTAS